MKEQNIIRNTNTINKIKESMINLLNEKPLQKITINDICDKASINRSTFYLHYYDQYDLHDDLKKEALDMLLVYVNQSFVNGDYLPIESFLRICKESKLIRTFFTYSGCHLFYNDLKNCVYPILFEKTSEYLSQMDQDYIYAFILDGSSSVIAKWINKGCIDSEKYISQLIIDICSSTNIYRK